MHVKLGTLTIEGTPKTSVLGVFFRLALIFVILTIGLGAGPHRKNPDTSDSLQQNTQSSSSFLKKKRASNNDLGLPRQLDQNIEKIILIARKLALGEKRLEAVEFMVRAIEVGQTHVVASLKKEISSQAKFFYLNDTQSFFELGESLFLSDLSLAQAKYEKGLELEPYNIQLLKGIIRTSLNRKNCKEAKAKIVTGKRVDPYDPELSLLEIWASRCMDLVPKKLLLAIEKLSVEAPKNWDPHNHIILQLAAIENNKKLQLETKAKSQLKELLAQPAFVKNPLPEAYFWALKLELSQAKEYAKKYVDDCTQVSPQLRKSYKNYPLLCTFLSEIEVYTKN